MANVLSLALRVTADASGLRLDPVQRALVGLGDQAEKLTSQFAKFSGGSEAAAAAQARFEQQSQDLINTLRDGGPGAATQFAAAFERLTEAANKEAAAFQRAQQITEANLTTLERFDRAQAELTEQLNAGRISLETYNRATESAAKGLTDAERAARGLAVQTDAIDAAASGTTLQFNELSGVFSVLPGPLGNIAGRISGIASASEGLSRIFAGGLTAGFQGLVSSVTALINPFTLALAGITAFAAGATAVVRGLVALEDRVERLSRLATQLGVSFEFVQVLEEAGRRADVSIEQLSGSFARLQNTLAGADEESKKASSALQRLGVSVQDFGALSEQQRIDLIGERLAAIEDPAQRSAAAIALFGRSGVQLLPFFNELGLAAADMERFGRAVSDLDRERLSEFGGSIDALKLSTEGLGTSLLLPFVGLGDGIARGLAEVTAGITAIVDPIGRILEPLLTQIGRVVELIGVGIGNLGRTIGAVFEPFAVIVQEVSQALEPLYEGIFNFLQGISNAAVSVTEWVVSFTPIGAIAANVGALGETISRVVTIITTAFQRAGEFVGGLVSRFSELVAQSPFLQTLGDIISSTFGAVASVFSTIANAIGGVVGRLLTIAENFLGIERSAESAGESASKVSDGIDKASASTADLVAQQERAAQAAEKQSAEVQKIVDASLEQARIDNEFGGDSARFRAAENLLAVQGEIARVEEQLRAARETGDQAAIDALASRLAILDQVAAREDDIASGAKRQREEAERAAQQAAEQAEREAERASQQAQRQAEQAAAQAERAAEQARREAEREAERVAREAEKAAEQRRRAEEQITQKVEAARSQLLDRQFEIELARAEELATVRTGSVEINDIRSGGISAFFDTLKEDPAIAEAKKQTAELEKMRRELAKLNAEKVDILAGTG
jgi:phage-related protein